MYEGSKEEEYDELHEAERGSAAMVVHEVTYYIIHRFFFKEKLHEVYAYTTYTEHVQKGRGPFSPITDSLHGVVDEPFCICT